MSEDNTVDSLLMDIRDVYRSVDLRIITIRKDVQSLWQNFLTVTRFSCESISELTARYNSLTEKHGLLNSDKCKLIMKALTLPDWNQIKRHLFDQGKGLAELMIDDLTIHYWPHDGLPKYKLHPSTVYEYKCSDWPIFQIGLQERISPPPSSEINNLITVQSDYQRVVENEVGEALRCGFGDMKKAATYYMESHYESSRMDPQIYIVIPLYAKMSQPFFEKNKISVEVTAHGATPLQVNYRRGQSDQYMSTIIQEHAANKVKLDAKSSKEILTQKVELEELKADNLESLPDDLVIVSLAYLGDGGAEITYSNKPLRHLVAGGAPEVANPLLSALQLFCSSDYISKVLQDPQGMKESITLQTSKIFERTVTWLLQSGGYDAIWLVEKDVWKDSKTGFQYGTADILAYYPSKKHLYVIGCSLIPPKPDELLGVVRTASKVNEKLFGRYQSSRYPPFQPIKVLPVYVYSWDIDPEIASLAVRNNAISISRRGLQKMYDELNLVMSLKPLEEYKDEERTTLPNRF